MWNYEIVRRTTTSLSIRGFCCAMLFGIVRPDLMAQPLQVDLSEEQRDELIDVRDHHEKPYMREKAAAVLKVAGLLEGEGQSARQVALNGLLRERRPNTVRDWVHTYKEEGIDGFLVEEGRGQKPAFSPDR
jgi:hypothetical protein